MIFKQFYLESLAQASYLIGDEKSGIAMVVDPQRDVDLYVDYAHTWNLTIRYVLLTHFHADFVAGHIELRNRTGAEICLGAKAHAGFQFRSLPNEYKIEFGNVRLIVLETPGHTMESISLVVYNLATSKKKPYAVLTGDTLFIGDVGRPDLMASPGMKADELAAHLYDSLHEKLLVLPDDTRVYPAHGAGAQCGRSHTVDIMSTIKEERRENHALQPMRKEEFIQRVNAYQPEVPQYFDYDAYLNRREHPDLEAVLKEETQPLSLQKVIQLKSDMAQIVDVRNSADFAGSHLNGSINIGLGGNLAAWAGTILDRDHPIVIIAEPGCEREAMVQLGRVGYDRIVGYLKGGMQALNSTPELVQCTKRMTASSLSKELAKPGDLLILDVRTEQEWLQRRITDSLNIPLPQVEKRLCELYQQQTLVIYCTNGYRSSIAASLLQKHGFMNIKDLIGGFDAWEQEVVVPML
ncbi:MAG: MBL fold metallo-hydrolase [Nitrospirales bacterium]|nr:MBL fold metallo-hydrolase [Nitrospirales bacterium]